MNHMMHSDEPWLNQPVMLHSSRKYTCSLDTQEQCEWQQGYWRFWYEADHRYALPTIAFFMAVIIIFSLIYLLSKLTFRNGTLSRTTARVVALNRYLTQRSFRIDGLNWNSAPLGVLCLGGVGTIFFFAMTLGPQPYYWPNTSELSYGSSPPIATRAGYMSLACMPFVFATSPKSNMITALTGVSHEKLQTFHRWISYAMYVLALIHTFPFIIFHIWKGDMVKQWNTTVYYWTGAIILLAQTYLTFASMSPLRNMCYEWFKYSHFIAAIVWIVFYFFHCNFRLTSWDYFIATAVTYSLCWLHGQMQMFIGNRTSKAVVDLTTNGFIRVVIPTRTTWEAGQHYFVRFFGLGRHSLSTHPFTVCSLPSGSPQSELVFYIRAQGGLTSALVRHLEANPTWSTNVLLDGPYGGTNLQQLARAQRLILVAGGSGAGWLLPMIETFLRQNAKRRYLQDTSDSDGGKIEKANNRTARVILATREQITKQWFVTALDSLLASFPDERSSNSLEVEVYCTADNHELNQKSNMTQPPSDSKEISTDVSIGRESQHASDAEDSPPRTVHVSDQFHGRPNIPAIIESEAIAGAQSIGVFACGPLSMQSDLSNAVAKQQIDIMKNGSKEIYLHMEHFSWA
ncbi:hypothetical protein Q7P37_007695 [Cladosporium fusiforme]